MENMSAKIMRLWQLKPVRFMKDCFDFTPDLWQEECSELYMNNQRLAMICSKGPGKTALLAVLGWHFFLTNRLAKMAALAVTKDNLKANLWAELSLWGARSALVSKSVTIGVERITLNGFEKVSFIDARSYRQSADEHEQASALAGLHADNVAFIIDEAGTIPDAVLITADAALAGTDGPGKRARMLVTANPEVPSGLIYKASKGLTYQKWATYHVSGDPDDPKRAPRVSKDWARGLIQEHGIDSAIVRINVLGKYPHTSSEQLLTEEEIMESVNREIDEKSTRRFETRMGVDVARGGVDSSILAIRKGRKVLAIVPVSSSLDSTEVAAQVVMYANKYKVDRVLVDDTGGYGSGVVDNLQFQYKIIVQPINYSRNARDSKHCYNLRSEMYLKMRDWVRSGGKLPNDVRLKADLLCPKLFYLKGRFRLEDKEQIKKRLGVSPDRADALAQTFVDEEFLQGDSVVQKKLGAGSAGYVSKGLDKGNPHGMYQSY